MRDFIKALSIKKEKTIIISSHILSEIELLADDIGIIHNGVLLEESSYAELKKKMMWVVFGIAVAMPAIYVYL